MSRAAPARIATASVLAAAAAAGFAFLLVAALAGLEPYPWLEAAYRALPEEGYLRYVRPHEVRSEIKVQNLLPHWIAMGIQGLVVTGALWALRERHATAGRGSDWPAWRAWLTDGPGPWLFLGAGLVMTAHVLACFVSFLAWQPVCRLYAKEGVLDTTHFVGFLGSALLLGLAAWRLRARPTIGGSRPALWLIGTASVACLIMGMEEISWGQTYFHWRTPDGLAAINTQDETNLHNIFNRYLSAICYLLGLGGLLLLAGGVALGRRLGRHPLAVAIPPAWLLAAGVWLPVASPIFVYSATEVFETVMTIIAVCYGLTVWQRSREPAWGGVSTPIDIAARGVAAPAAAG